MNKRTPFIWNRRASIAIFPPPQTLHSYLVRFEKKKQNYIYISDNPPSSKEKKAITAGFTQ